MNNLLARLLEVERSIVWYDKPAPANESAIGLLAGNQPLLISAPHSARHWREGDWKQEEEYTAALGYLLHQATGAHFIYGRYLLNPDPHDDHDCGPYKQKLDELFTTTPIRFVLDLHGARGDRDFMIAVGTMDGESCADYEQPLLTVFQNQGFTFDSDSSLDRLALNPPRYTGGIRLPTITRYAWRHHHIPAAQIEINAWARLVERLPNAYNAVNGTSPNFRGDGSRIERTYTALLNFIRYVLGVEKE